MKTPPRRSLQISRSLHGLVLISIVVSLSLLLTSLWLNQGSHSVRLVAAHKHERQILNDRFKPLCGVSGSFRVHCDADVLIGSNGNPVTGTPANSSAYGPVQIHTAYQIPCKPGGQVASICATPSSFGPETVAIVDDGGYVDSSGGSIASSLANYDNNYGLPACTAANGCLTIVNQAGQSSPLPSPNGSSWSVEMDLDVQTVHMVCQTCKIVLIEATPSNSVSGLAAANGTAASFDPAAVSNSWTASPDDTAGVYTADFNTPGIAYVAAAGDSGSSGGGAGAWPSDMPNVVSVAGSTLTLNTDNSRAAETVWADTGGYCSSFYAAPQWQTSLSNWATAGCGAYRGYGDISADADPNTGVAVYVGTAEEMVGGTSLAAPIIAAMYALAGGVPSTVAAPSIPYRNDTPETTYDITSGSNCIGVTTNCTAGIGYDEPSGVGAPVGLGDFTAQPFAPSNLTATDIDQASVRLNWTAPSGSDPIAHYQIFRNSVDVGTTTQDTYDDSGLSPNTSYSYQIVAIDGSNVDSLPSVAQTVTTYYPEDINEDGHINLLDLSLLASAYGQSGSNLGRVDINTDGTVNLLDLSLLAAKYGSE